MRIVHIRLLTLLEAEDNKEMLDDIKLIENLSPIKMAKLISNRLLKDDCRNKGWVIEGYPRTYEQGLALQAEGVLIQHFSEFI
jgi:adenylate kinase family enzyme